MRSYFARLRKKLREKLRGKQLRRLAILPLGAVTLMALGNGYAGALQNDVSRPTSQPPSQYGEAQDQRDPTTRLREEKLEKERNNERQLLLVRDTDRLLALARDLKAEVDKSNKDTLSIDVVKKAAEIEKLAKSVKDRMRQ